MDEFVQSQLILAVSNPHYFASFPIMFRVLLSMTVYYIDNFRWPEMQGLTVVTHVLREGGKFIAKIFRGKDTSLLYTQVD